MATYQMNRSLDPGDRLSHCADKIGFIKDTFIGEEEKLTETGRTGLVWMLWEIEDELRFIYDETGRMLRNKGKEKEDKAGKEAS